MDNNESPSSNNLRAIVQAAIAAAGPGGSTWRYFMGNGLWRGRVSELAGILADRIAEEPIPSLMPAATVLLREINSPSAFATRQRVEDLETIARLSLEGIKTSGIDRTTIGRGLSESESGRIARAYMAILRRCEPPCVRNRPWSLLSKWLHMLLPDTFVIYDKNAASSLKTWAEREYVHLNATHIERLQFDVDNRYWVKNWSDPSWYLGILRFYDKVQVCATSTGSAQDLTAAAALLQTQLAMESRWAGARVTALDVIDSLLWMANGDATKLGLDA